MREFDLLQHVYAGNADLPAHVAIAPGDDLAMVRLDDHRLLTGVDQLVEGRHVNLGKTELELIGRKAVARSLSDVAAMAGVPVGALVAATLPPDFGADRATQLFDAMRETGAHFGCPLVGGDIAVHASPGAPLVCSVTVLATPAGPGPVTRSGAKVGDAVYVTGTLGGSFDRPLDGHHLTFRPRLDEAVELLRALGPALHAMIDISDGLGRDAGHIAAASGAQIVLESDLVPCSAGLSWERAMSDGEDYELCFTASGAVPSAIGTVPVTRVGEVVAARELGTAHVLVRSGRDLIDGDELGWQHES